MIRVGVVVFPGSNRDIDAVNALEVAGAEPVIAVARAGATSTGSPRSSCRAASPTATTCAPA